MENPWKSIDLDKYEKHMELPAIRQSQSLNDFMDRQFNAFPVKSVMILGVAGGNGLEHIDTRKIQKVYGIDINRRYISECEKRHAPKLKDALECLCIDLTDKNAEFPHADIVVADLLIEYVGYEAFRDVIKKVAPKYVSCVIQKNTDGGFVSASPYIHIFDELERIHSDITEERLSETLEGLGYFLTDKDSKPLPNGKSLIMLTYTLQNPS